MQPHGKVITTNQFAQRLGVPVPTVRAAMARNELPVARTGGRLFIPVGALRGIGRAALKYHRLIQKKAVANAD